jgi:hypothetical protein
LKRETACGKGLKERRSLSGLDLWREGGLVVDDVQRGVGLLVDAQGSAGGWLEEVRASVGLCVVETQNLPSVVWLGSAVVRGSEGTNVASSLGAAGGDAGIIVFGERHLGGY